MENKPDLAAFILAYNESLFIRAQLDHLYQYVSKIVVIEGADQYMEQVTGSKRSTDGTIELIQAYPDPENKIKLVFSDGDKNDRSHQGNRELKDAEYILQVDCDEFYTWPHLYIALDQLIERDADVACLRQHYVWKWTDAIFQHAGRPPRLWRNRISEGKLIHHIPWGCYYPELKAAHMVIPKGDAGLHYLAISYDQIKRKLDYYNVRGDHTYEHTDLYLEKWLSTTRNMIDDGVSDPGMWNRVLCTNDVPSWI